MDFRFSTSIFALCLPLCPVAQGEESPLPRGQQTLPEEVQIIEDRHLYQLRNQLLEAEQNAYEIFNTFNDDKRFTITCSLQAPLGTHIKNQVCQPGFEREALRDHAQDYLSNMRDPNSYATHAPVEVVLATLQPEYKRTMRQVAEEHPEFLEAIIKYSEVRAQYVKSASTRSKE